MTSSQSEAHPPAARKLSSTRRRQLTGGALLIAVVVVLIDQGTKVWAEATLTDRERIPLIGDLLGLQLAYNPGAAFSFGKASPGCSRCSLSPPRSQRSCSRSECNA